MRSVSAPEVSWGGKGETPSILMTSEQRRIRWSRVLLLRRSIKA